MLLDERDIAEQEADQAVWDTLTDDEKRRHIAAWRIRRATDNALAHAAITLAEQAATRTPKVLVKATTIVRRKGYFLRLCECKHAGRANFHGDDQDAAFRLIASDTWRCGYCLTERVNPGKDDAEYAAALKRIDDGKPTPLPLGVCWDRAEIARFRDGEGER